MSYTQAIPRAIAQVIRELGEKGLWVNYPPKKLGEDWHRSRVDVAIRRAVLTGVNQTCAEVVLVNMDEMGSDLVETTAHMGARSHPTDAIANHAGWQGRWFSRSGTHPFYPDFKKSTGYGQGKGLCGWNCRHSFFAVIEGISTPSYTQVQLDEMRDAAVEYNGETIPWYKATQMQREMERDIRATKREMAALTSAKSAAYGEPATLAELDKGFAEEAVKLKRQERQLKDFLEQTGLVAQRERLRVHGFRQSEAGSAVWADRKISQAIKLFADLVGQKTANGVAISSLSDHFGDRARERGVTVENVLDALIFPLKTGKIKIDNYGRKSQSFVGEKATVVINPDTGTLVTTHLTHTKLAEKLKRKKEGFNG